MVADDDFRMTAFVAGISLLGTSVSFRLLPLSAAWNTVVFASAVKLVVPF